MIKASELRIGNWVNWIRPSLPPTYEKVYSLVDTEEINEDNPDMYEPIPLIPEILEKAGFRNICRKDIFEIKINNGALLWSDNSVTVRLNNNREFELEINCKYLHEFQNLYFVLTCEELKINL